MGYIYVYVNPIIVECAIVNTINGRFGINDDYPGPSSYASPSDYAGPSSFASPSSFVGPSDYAGTSSHACPSVSNEQDDEPEADSFLNNEHVDSEPDEVEVEGLTTNNPENNDEVSIEVMIDVLGNTASGPRSQRQDHFYLNMSVFCEPTNLYSVIPFFEAMNPEVPADSIDMPTGAWGNFYDSNTGELAIGMVFKSKDHLKASVQDFSVRFARWEYRVVESKPKLWKVDCKYDQQTGCSWMLRGIFQPNMGLFKITKYVGPHTCLMNEISVEHDRQWLDQCNQLCSGIQISSWGSSFCLRHVCSNFNKKFNNIRLKDLCWRAGAEVNARKFERIMTEIRELNEEAYNWLGMIDKTQWTLSHDSGWRTGILTTNMSECVNGVLKGSHTYVVKLKHKTCFCGKWGTHGIPCSHAIRVSRHFGVNASNFIPQYYSIQAYRKTYQGRFEPLYGEEYWDPVDIELVHNSEVRVRRGPADMFRRGYQMKWIDHKHVLANNINLVKFRINV
ncbi:hypothetical protein Sango_1840300 [Sesamum angolense]|uniref:SWIM-type domain-containing protein n=1 Tax=Sesamum angolense TaxID=2727404 RepID=A0AAE2BQF0_9LAMI|nr:hypothetical protein Sango_1840300 [Sesamum angolense]